VETLEALPEPIIPLSIMEGWTEGTVFADDPLDPDVVFVWETKGNGNLFFCGKSSRRNAQMLGYLLQTAIIPACELKGLLMSIAAWDADGWEEFMPVIVASRPPVRDRMLLYTLAPEDAEHDGVAAALEALTVPPQGFEVRAVDAGILASSDIVHGDEVRKEILKQWRSLDDFLSKGFGYCLLGDNTITSWCLAEYPAGHEISIGVETADEHRRKGHATVVSAATIRECVVRGITPYWNLWMANTPSKRLAERVMLKRKADYPVIFFYHNEIDNFLVNGNAAFRRNKDVDAAVRWYDRAFAVAKDDAARSGSMLADESRRRWWLKTAAEAYAAAGVEMHGVTRSVVERLRNLESPQ